MEPGGRGEEPDLTGSLPKPAGGPVLLLTISRTLIVLGLLTVEIVLQSTVVSKHRVVIRSMKSLNVKVHRCMSMFRTK